MSNVILGAVNMKCSIQTVIAGHWRPAFHTALAVVMLGAATLAQAGTVIPPPLPPGSAMVKVEPGMNKEERERQNRAHHHKGHYKKNITLDDSVGKGNDKGSKK